MGIDRIAIRPAENGYIVNVSMREESKRKGGDRPSSYSEKDKIATNEDDVLKLVSSALGKTKKGRGLRVRAERGGEGEVKSRGKKKSGSKKKMTYKR